ncbi:MAG: hypothetical protein KBD01_07840 [Acidobacteria bacterium]|nr:hypothetical protein [Acidobacteriota bacterium]
MRREVRDILGQLLTRSSWGPVQFEQALEELSRQRRIALRQILLFYGEQRVADEVAALELLGRLARPEDASILAGVANDPTAPEPARVACALALLGHDRADLITDRGVSGLVLRWQARFVAEEPSLRFPLLRLYRRAGREDRAGWIALQDQELKEPEGRAAVFEMLLEVEEDPDLRVFLLEALSRAPHAACRAALRRVRPQDHEERDIITGALACLAAAADAECVPDGWSAKAGFCDGTGSYAVRFDFRRRGARPRSAMFVLNLDNGVREVLALTGGEVDRYDALPVEQLAPCPEDGPPTLLSPLPVPEALGLLVDAERSDQREGRTAPRDYLVGRRLLDPLADLRPRLPDPLPVPLAADLAQRSAELLELPGYSGWFYDSGDHTLDELRLELLHRGKPGRRPSEEVITRAAEKLARAGEARRLARMLRHNAMVHRNAGEPEYAAIALSTAMALGTGSFITLPLVRRMICESLHPGHYFFAPSPDGPSRATLLGMMLGRGRPTKGRVFAVDLAWILGRAADVWLSRVPSANRPHADHVQDAVLAAAWAGARCVGRWLARRAEGHPLRDGRERFRAELLGEFRGALAATHFPEHAEGGKARLADMMVAATEALVFSVCLRNCPHRCPADPRRLARDAARPEPFPAGPGAEIMLRTWPGLYAVQPNAAEQRFLAEFLRAGSNRPRRAAGSDGVFICVLCGQPRPAGARTTVRFGGTGEEQLVCRRCRARYRRDPAFRSTVVSSHGEIP